MVTKKEIEKAVETKEVKAKKEHFEMEAASETKAKAKEINENMVEEPISAATTESKENSDPAGNEIEEEPLSSLDILWHHVFKELDEWTAHADLRDENFLKEAMYYVETIKRNQGNLKEVTDQFNREFLAWERAAREEFLMSTTSLQHFFPLKSYEDINQQIDNIQSRTMSILSSPFQVVPNIPILDNYVKIIEQYISLRKKSRMQYIKMVKQTSNLVYENQKGFVNLFSRQLRTLLFPLNKYLEKAEEKTLS